MPNPIRTSELVQDDGAILVVLKQLLRLRADFAKTVASIKTQASGLSASLASISGNSKAAADQIFKVSQQVAILQGEYKKVTASLTGVNKKIASLTKELKKVQGVQKNLGTATASMNKNLGNMSTSMGKVEKSTKKTFGVVKRFFEFFVLSKIVGGIRNMFTGFLEIARSIDSLELSYSKILKTQKDVDDSFSFTSQIAKEYGVNLLALQKSYVKFRAAADSSNVPIEKSDQIFKSVTKSVAALGLSTSDTNLIFLALEQIMAKGTVSSEELRRQLSEKLPVAFGAMAKAAGVTTGELTKLLKEGKLASNEILPKFAVELEKALGIENLNKVETIAASQERYNNAIVEFVRSLEAGGVIKEFFNTLAAGITFLADNVAEIIALTKVILTAAAAYGTWRLSLALSTAFMNSTILSTKALTLSQKAFTLATIASRKAVDLFTLALQRNPLGLVATALVSVVGLMWAFRDSLDGVNTEIERNEKRTEALNKQITEEARVIDRMFAVLKNANSSYEERRIAIDLLQKLYPDYIGNIDLEKASIEDLTVAQNELNASRSRESIIEAKNVETESIKKELDSVRERIKLIQEEGEEALTGIKIGPLASGEKGTFFDQIVGFKDEGETQVEFTLRRLNGKLALLQGTLRETKDYYDDLLYPDGKKIISGSGKGGIVELYKNLNEELKKEKEEAAAAAKKIADQEEKDFQEGIRKRRLLANALPEGQTKEEILFEIEYDVKEHEFEKYQIKLSSLEEFGERERAAIRQKYIDQEIERRRKKFDDIIDLRKAQASLIDDDETRDRAMAAIDAEVEALETGFDVAEILKKKLDAIDEKYAKIKYERLLDEFDTYQGIDKQKFLQTERSTKERNKFELEQEKQKLLAILTLNETVFRSLSDIQVEEIEETIKRIEAAIKNLGTEDNKKTGGLFGLLGINLNSEEEKAISDAFNLAKDSVEDYFETKKRLAEEDLRVSERLLDEAQRVLEIQLKNDAEGYASSIEGARKEVEAKRKARDQDLKNIRDAQKQEIALQSALQAANLITASTTIFKQLGIFAYPALALMWGTFIGAKIKAFQLTKAVRREGGFDEIKQGTHANNTDTYLGYSDNKGNPVYAERNEVHMVVKPKGVKKTGVKKMKEIWSALNKGKFNELYSSKSEKNINTEYIIDKTNNEDNNVTYVSQSPVNNEQHTINNIAETKNIVNAIDETKHIINQINDTKNIVNKTDEIENVTNKFNENNEIENIVNKFDERKNIFNETENIVNKFDENILNEINETKSIINEIDERKNIVNKINETKNVTNEIDETKNIVSNINKNHTLINKVYEKQNYFQSFDKLYAPVSNFIDSVSMDTNTKINYPLADQSIDYSRLNLMFKPPTVNLDTSKMEFLLGKIAEEKPMMVATNNAVITTYKGRKTIDYVN